MGKVLFQWILIGVLIKVAGSIEIDNLGSGSKSCDVTVRFNPIQVLLSPYQNLEILKHGNSRFDVSLVDCSVLSVRILRTSGGRITSKKNILSGVVTKKHNSHKMVLQHRDFKRLPADGVLVELNCKDRRCFLLSADNITKKNIESSWIVPRRKLLSMETENDVHNKHFSAVAPLVVAIAGIIVLVIALAMCTCSNNAHEKALSNEVGGTEVDPRVISVSSVMIKEKNERRNTTDSKKSEVNAQRNSLSLAENGEVKETGRTTSQSSQPDKGSVERGESRLRNSISHNSVDKIDEVVLVQLAPEKSSDSTGCAEKDRKRTGSEKEVTLADKDSSSEARTRTNSSEGAKKGLFRIPTKKRTGSDDKEPKASPNEHDEHKAKFWQRKKSSKTNPNSELNENPSPSKKEKEKGKKKKKSKKIDQTPEHVSSSTRSAVLPLPPTPSSFVDEETHYEVVESCSKIPRSSHPAVSEYETVTSSKTKTYDKVNAVINDQTRSASELYECINDEDAKMKRISSGSNQYDVVETRSPPKKSPANLEYAYSVVASQDNITIPMETSGSSGLYEVVSDNIKQGSGVLDVRKSDVGVEDDYAVVQKDPSKKRGSKNDADQLYSLADKERMKSLPAEMYPAPAPPPVSSLISAVSSSVRKRAQSEGDDLNVVERSDSPVDSNSPSPRPQTMFEVDQTYAKVNFAMKKRYSEEAAHHDHDCAPASALPKGYNEQSDTPPPIPPSLYADLESTRRMDDEENKNELTSFPIAEPRNDDDENAYEEVAATKVEIKSITSTPLHLKIPKRSETTEVNQVQSTSPKDPKGVPIPPAGPSRNSDVRVSGNCSEGKIRLSSGSHHDYDEVLTTLTKRSSDSPRVSKELGSEPVPLVNSLTSDLCESLETEPKNNSTNEDNNHLYEAVVEKEKPTTTDDKIVSYV